MFKIISRKDWAVIQEVIEEQKKKKEKELKRQKEQEEEEKERERRYDVLSEIILFLFSELKQEIGKENWTVAYYLKSLIHENRSKQIRKNAHGSIGFKDYFVESHFKDDFDFYKKLLDNNFKLYQEIETNKKNGAKDV